LLYSNNSFSKLNDYIANPKKDIIIVGNKKTIISNFISLSVAQGLSILFPIITFPYLLRVLGVEAFGMFTLIQTLIMYFDLLVSFGLNLTATQHISGNTSDTVKIKQVIVSVYFIKIFLFICSVIMFLICSLFIPYLRENIFLVFIASLSIFGNLLFPDWFFQGIQKMRNITLVAFVSKATSLVFIIFLVKQPSDIVYAIFALSAGNLIGGFIGFFLLWKKVEFKAVLPVKAYTISLFKESSYVFASIILAPLYSSVNIFILQAFTSPLMVGYYAIAVKIYDAIGMLSSIANRSLFPHLAMLYKTSVTIYRQKIKKIISLFAITFTFMAILQFFAAEDIVGLISGKGYEYDLSYSVGMLKIMSIGLLFSPFASFFFQLMVLQDQKKTAIKNITITVIINLISGCLLAYFYSGKGMAINLCLIVFIIAALNYKSFSNKLNNKLSAAH